MLANILGSRKNPNDPLGAFRDQVTDIRNEALTIKMGSDYVPKQRNTPEDYQSMQDLRSGIAKFAGDLGSTEDPNFFKYVDLTKRLDRVQGKYLVVLEKEYKKDHLTSLQKIKRAVYNHPYLTLGAVSLVGAEVYYGFPVTISTLSIISNGISSKGQELAEQYPLIGQISGAVSPVLSSISGFFSDQVAPTISHWSEAALTAIGITNPAPQPSPVVTWWKIW